MNILENIKTILRMYHVGTSQESATLPGAIAIVVGEESNEWRLLQTALSHDKLTFMAVGPGYWGKGATIMDAAKQCKKAGCPSMSKVILKMFIGDDDAQFLGIQVEYKQGATCVDLGVFSLNHLLAAKPA